MDQSLWSLLIVYPQTPNQAMPRNDGAMLLRLLGVLTLSSLGSTMLMPNDTSGEPREEDPNTHYYDGPDMDSDPSTTPPRLGNSRDGLLPLPPSEDPASNYSNYNPPSRSFGTTDPMLPSMPDTSICDFLLSSPVPPPIDQIPFFCFCSHCKGTAGPKGDRGDRGPPGMPGSAGIRGMTGFKGNPGFTGPAGMKGQKGDLGERGLQGPLGYNGTKGERGFKGEKGDRGLMGPPGDQGPQGQTGTCPASCETIQGPPGLQGAPGPAGVRGLPGIEGPVGAKGLRGDKGDLGIPGQPGLIGQKGEQGEQGLCKCTNGVNGTDGRAGEKGAKGDKGDIGNQGVQGLTGQKGHEGLIGPTGPPGPCTPTVQSAFSASLVMSYPQENQPIPFPNVFFNQQGHYNPMNGIYTAPANGTYVLSFHLAVANRALKVGLFRNLFPIVRTTEANNQATASQTVILHLNMGDQVWLQVKNGVTNGIYADSESSSTFSGYLLYPDNCDIPLGRDFFGPQEYNAEDYSWDGPPSTTAPPSTTMAHHGDTTVSHHEDTTVSHHGDTTVPPHGDTTVAHHGDTTVAHDGDTIVSHTESQS